MRRRSPGPHDVIQRKTVLLSMSIDPLCIFGCCHSEELYGKKKTLDEMSDDENDETDDSHIKITPVQDRSELEADIRHLIHDVVLEMEDEEGTADHIMYFQEAKQDSNAVFSTTRFNQFVFITSKLASPQLSAGGDSNPSLISEFLVAQFSCSS